MSEGSSQQKADSSEEIATGTINQNGNQSKKTKEHVMLADITNMNGHKSAKPGKGSNRSVKKNEKVINKKNLCQSVASCSRVASELEEAMAVISE
ncbi:hypothetical protein Q3G72_031867 [Acer saccharum]|nr:hypothetical protein Q3G72_031867 [Acer saccharum]